MQLQPRGQRTHSLTSTIRDGFLGQTKGTCVRCGRGLTVSGSDHPGLVYHRISIFNDRGRIVNVVSQVSSLHVLVMSILS